jgi:hypothetical protein
LKSRETHDYNGDDAFLRAYGHQVMVDSGISQDLTRPESLRAARDFSKAYTGRDNAKQRDSFRKALKKQIK